MSRGDVLVSIPSGQIEGAPPSVGDPLIVEIDLPANHAFGQKCMQCQTTVVRTESPADGDFRIALRIHKMRFQSLMSFETASEHQESQLQRVVM
jgi:hypothetical protein